MFKKLKKGQLILFGQKTDVYTDLIRRYKNSEMEKKPPTIFELLHEHFVNLGNKKYDLFGDDRDIYGDIVLNGIRYHPKKINLEFLERLVAEEKSSSDLFFKVHEDRKNNYKFRKSSVFGDSNKHTELLNFIQSQQNFKTTKNIQRSLLNNFHKPSYSFSNTNVSGSFEKSSVKNSCNSKVLTTSKPKYNNNFLNYMNNCNKSRNKARSNLITLFSQMSSSIITGKKLKHKENQNINTISKIKYKIKRLPSLEKCFSCCDKNKIKLNNEMFNQYCRNNLKNISTVSDIKDLKKRKDYIKTRNNYLRRYENTEKLKATLEEFEDIVKKQKKKIANKCDKLDSQKPQLTLRYKHLMDKFKGM